VVSPAALGGVAAIAVGCAAGWLAPDDPLDRHVMPLTILSGLWFLFCFSVFAFDMWVKALGG
jgi:hypothetical protein